MKHHPFHIEIGEFFIEQGVLSEEQVKGMEDAVHRCLIHNTLTHPPTIVLAVRGAATVAG